MKSLKPPSSNTGVTTPPQNPLQANNQAACSDLAQMEKIHEKTAKIEFNAPKYDWFAGQLKGSITGVDLKGSPVYKKIEPSEYLETVLNLFNQNSIEFDEVHDTLLLGRYVNKKSLFVCKGYQEAYHIKNNGESILSISYGGHNGLNSLYVSSTGSACDTVFRLIKQIDLNLYASRVDACYDTQQDMVKLKYRITEYCRLNKLKYRIDGTGFDENGNRTGETLYIDLTASKRIRIYEKGFERLAENPSSNAPLDWVRFEIETKGDIANKDQGRMILTQSEPIELLTIDKHCTALFNRFAGTRKEPSMIQFNSKKISDHETARLHMIAQYNKVIKRSLNNPEDFFQLVSDTYGTLDHEDVPDWISRFALLNGAFISGKH